MARDLFASQKTTANYWDDETPPQQQPRDLFELAADPSVWEKVKSGLKQNFAGIWCKIIAVNPVLNWIVH